MAEFDSPWKEALDVYFQPFLAHCFPAVHDGIDWTRGYEPLDKELQKILRAGETGRRVVDKLIRVWRTAGEEEWILVHVEVQSQPEADFPRRMFVYHYRLLDRYNKRVVSLAVLGDSRADWRPNRYSHRLWDCGVEFDFPIVKLLDFDDDALEESDNPFATLVLAHLKTQETLGSAGNRYSWKLRLIKGLYDRGLGADQIRQLFRFVDWMMELPTDMEKYFSDELHRFEEEKRMPYVTSVERLAHQQGIEQGIEQGIQKGVVQGLLEGIEMVLEIRFGEDAQPILEEIRNLTSADALRILLRQAKTVNAPEELRAYLSQ